VTTGNGGAAGGLVGANFGAITQSFATGNVTGGIGSYVGGLTAFNFGETGAPAATVGAISQSYATGAVTGGTNSVVGGLVAENGGSLDQTYATGLVTAGAGSVTGGLVASNNFTLPAGLGGNASIPTGLSTTPGTATNSYWDTQTTGQNASAGGSPMTTAQLTTGLPAGFSTTAWNAGGGTNYPALAGQPNPLPTPGQPAPNNPTTNPCSVNSTQCPTTPTTPTSPQTPNQPGSGPTTPDQPVTIALQSPQLAVAANLVQNTKFDPPPTDNLNLTPPNPPSGSSGPSGSNPGTSNRPGTNPNGGRPGINQVPPPGLGLLPSGMPAFNEFRFRNDEVVMQLGADMTPEQVAAFVRPYGLEVIQSQNFSLLGRTVYRFRITGGQQVRQIIAALEKPDVSFQPSYNFTLDQGSSAPSEGDSAQYIVQKLHLPEAHAIATGKGVTVAVIDSEIDSEHPDLKGAVTGAFDALPSTDQTPHPHGTGMAGAIVSHQRLLGIAPSARILAVRAFGVDDKGAQGTSMNIVKGLQWAVDQGAKVINMSFAGPRDPLLQQAIKKLSDDGIILVAAAGNAGPKSPPLFPGADANVIAVSATDVDDKTYKNANRGKYVAISAPGVDILVPAPEGGYQLTTGTSVAAAHISGVIALMKERNPNLTPAEARAILSATARNIGSNKNDVGAGLVDPVQALAKAGPKQARAK
jgi:subtilisin family serine protease